MSRNGAGHLLKKHRYVKRKARKVQRTGEYQERDRQFRKIARLKERAQRAGNPVISVDTKKKERLGNFYRDGRLYCQAAEVAYDHDYAHLAEGKVIPHGIYDTQYNDAMINIGTSVDTSEFACDSTELWWQQVGSERYRGATSLLILVDAGGSNSYGCGSFRATL